MTRDQITVAPIVASGKGDYGIYERVVTMGNGWSHKKQYRHWSLVATNRGVESAHGLQGHTPTTSRPCGMTYHDLLGPPPTQPTLEGFTQHMVVIPHSTTTSSVL